MDLIRRSFVLGLAATVLLFIPEAHAQSSCSNANFSGTYTMTVSGTYATVAKGTLYNYEDAVGQLVADGAGNFTGTMTSYTNKAHSGVGLSGTYSVAAGCAGSMVVNFTGGGGWHFDIFASATGFVGVGTDPLTNLSMELTQ